MYGLSENVFDWFECLKSVDETVKILNKKKVITVLLSSQASHYAIGL